MFKTEYDKLIRENFDLSDKHTRQFIATLEDAGQEQLLNTLSSAMYDNIVAKVDEIDFGSIPMSRGDITKVEGFDKTLNCLDIIRRLVSEYKQSTGVVDVVLSAIQNIRDRKAVFIKAYTLNAELPMLLYNSTVMAIERSTSLMIATCIEYIKDPTASSPKAALNKVAYQRTMDDVMFKQLITFNNMCANGTLDKAIDIVFKNPVKEDVEITTDIIGSDMNPDDNSDQDISNENPNAPLNTVDPFADPTADCAPQCTEDPESLDDMTGDTEIPASNEFPEDVDDDVDPDNLPIIVPSGDGTVDTNQPINEKEIHEGLGTVAKAGIGAAIGAGFLLLGGGRLISLAFNTLVNMARNMVYGMYYTRLKFSDFLEIQADLLEANANDLRFSTTSNLSDEERGKVVKNQYKWVEKLRKWSNMFAIDSKQTNNSVNKAIASEDKKKKTIGKNQYNDDVILF